MVSSVIRAVIRNGRGRVARIATPRLFCFGGLLAIECAIDLHHSAVLTIREDLLSFRSTTRMPPKGAQQ